MRELIGTLREIPGARVDFKSAADPDIVVAECHLPHLPGVTVCFSGSPSVLEWYLIIKDAISGRELWSDWMDYTGYGETDWQKLTAAMRTDIRFVLADLRRATDFRTYTTRHWMIFKLREAEWLIDGQWRAVCLYGSRE